MNSEHLNALLGRYFDQVLPPEDKSELERLLLESREAREMFWESARWHGSLRQWGQEEWGRRDASVVVTPQQPRGFRVLPASQSSTRGPGSAPTRSSAMPRSSSMPWWPLAAAAALVLGLFAWLNWPSRRDGTGQAQVALARISHASSAVWVDEASAHESGESLRKGALRLKSGALQVEFARGARVVLEGPAEFEILTGNSAMLGHGKMVAIVPASARGFTIRTSRFAVVDYGTEFGCWVPPASAAEVHVFKGAVGLEEPNIPKRDLREAQAVRIGAGELQEIPSNRDAFLTEEKLARLDSATARARLSGWRKSSERFRAHSGLLAYFDFEDAIDNRTARTLANRVGGAKSETHGSIVGCEWTEGRWPGKNALAFNGSDDRVRVSLPGEYTAMTFMAWVRADQTPSPENCLIGVDPDEKLGEVNWYISRGGAIGWSGRVAPRGRANQWLHVDSPGAVLTADMRGSWRFVATVYDGVSVTHYFDGRAVMTRSATLPQGLRVRLGQFELGNSSLGMPHLLGGFVGRIDEMAILSVPLTAEEIRHHFEQGRPGEK